MPITYFQLDAVSDSRGTVFEPIKWDDILKQKNVHVVISNPGIVRGNHYHLKGEETIVVMGPALVRFGDNAMDRDVEIPEKGIYRFVFPPNIPHAIKNTGCSPNMLIAFNTVEHDPHNPDTVPEVLI